MRTKGSMSEPGSYILNENLEVVLTQAIAHQRQLESSVGYSTHSAYLAGMIENLDYLKKYGTLEVRYHP